MTAAKNASASPGAEGEAQRIDKWLWCARMFKTRSLAAKTVAKGNFRVVRGGALTRVEKPSFQIRPEDEIAFTIGDRVKILKVAACAERRGPAPEAQNLYEDLSPPPPRKDTKPRDGEREKGEGRPTKKDRRALEAFKSAND